MQTPKHRAIYESPARLFLLIVATLFVTHTLMMALFAGLPRFSMWVESLIESLLLLLLLFPVLYHFSLRPLLLHIAEREQAEETMRQSEHKYRQLFENLSDAAFLIDVETGRILDANKQAESLLGCGRGQIMGMNQAKLYHAEKAEESRQHLARLAQEGASAGYDAVIIDQAGAAHVVNISGTPLTLFGRKLVIELVRADRQPLQA